MSEYFDNLCRAMKMLSEQPNVIFLGQGVGVSGTTMSDTLLDVPGNKRLEMPVAEDMQMGIAIGLSLEGHLPVCIFPRWNFLLLAANQLVNHLDRLPIYGNGYEPKVIIRTAIPSVHPFNPGPQHDDDFTDAFHTMFRTISIIRLEEDEEIVPAYMAAMQNNKSTLIVEMTELYKNERGK